MGMLECCSPVLDDVLLISEPGTQSSFIDAVFAGCEAEVDVRDVDTSPRKQLYQFIAVCV